MPPRQLSDKEKELVFATRDYCAERPLLIPKLMMSIDWTDPKQVDEARMLLTKAEEHITDQLVGGRLQLQQQRLGWLDWFDWLAWLDHRFG